MRQRKAIDMTTTAHGARSALTVGLDLWSRLKKFLTHPVPKPDHTGEVAPCGEPETHWYWKDIGWPCPRCASILEKKRKEEDETRMAEKIAAALARHIRDDRSNAKNEGLA